MYQEQLNSHISQNDLVFDRENHLKRNFERFYQMKNLLMEFPKISDPFLHQSFLSYYYQSSSLM